MTVSLSTDPQAWDAFLGRQRFRPFLQSWTMGEVYGDIGQEPVRIEMRDGDDIVGVCFGHVVPAKRGRHLAVPYGPVVNAGIGNGTEGIEKLITALKNVALQRGCTFIRVSPFWPMSASPFPIPSSLPSPLHLLAEHVWYLSLVDPDPWQHPLSESRIPNPEERLFSSMRSTTRNLIRRAEKEGVTVQVSDDPARDIESFIRLHDETRKRHKFTPYTNAFFRAQVARFAPRGECSLYLARYQGDVIAASVHMHVFGETSYHHGASSSMHAKIPASYLLQWTAIRDALKRGDHVYNFWGIAPPHGGNPKSEIRNPKHPFAGVTLFKTGFGGNVLNLVHCVDFPLRPSYHLTRTFEVVRKWRRGF
ncbi:MAG: hypothetical protein G01um101425_633 [Candidatus Peregrinibacteria bacterium Gr01-1014_25]|nr:MAG: hypothetical protein G01um101425_633 [Candidatus Peregrinibacteria bacterium Gr01-1014_25]